MKVRRFLLDVMEANAYLAWCETTKAAILIDCGDWPAAIPAFVRANGLQLEQIFITHDHPDHSDGVPQAVADFNPMVYAAEPVRGAKRFTRLEHGARLRVGDLEGRVVATPGHTPDGLSLLFPGHAFTGDALFAGSVGGTPEPDNARLQIEAIREHLFCLPDGTLTHGGHGPSSTVGVEKRYNPFFV